MDLHGGVRQFVVRVFHPTRNHLKLHRHHNLHKHVILRLCLHLHRLLLDPERHQVPHHPNPGAFEAEEPGGGGLVKLTKVFDDGNRILRDADAASAVVPARLVRVTEHLELLVEGVQQGRAPASVPYLVKNQQCTMNNLVELEPAPSVSEKTHHSWKHSNVSSTFNNWGQAFQYCSILGCATQPSVVLLAPPVQCVTPRMAHHAKPAFHDQSRCLFGASSTLSCFWVVFICMYM